MNVEDLRVGDVLISQKDYLQSSPILKEEEVTVVGFLESGSIMVTRNNKEDSIEWSLDKKDFDKTYTVYTVKAEDSTKATRIDSHYDYFYELSQFEAEFLQVKIDPYFVANQWKIGEKDNTGCIFHILKTIARFGVKNTKEREIKALHATVKRLAELEGVELE